MNPWKIFNILISKATAISLAFSLAVSITAQAKVAVLDRVVAVVNDDIVLQSELNQRTASIYRNIRESGTQPPSLEILRKNKY